MLLPNEKLGAAETPVPAPNAKPEPLGGAAGSFAPNWNMPLGALDPNVKGVADAAGAFAWGAPKVNDGADGGALNENEVVGAAGVVDGAPKEKEVVGAGLAGPLPKAAVGAEG